MREYVQKEVREFIDGQLGGELITQKMRDMAAASITERCWIFPQKGRKHEFLFSCCGWRCDDREM